MGGAPARHMHKRPTSRAVDRHPARIPAYASLRAPRPAPRDPEPPALSAAEIRRIVLDIIG